MIYIMVVVLYLSVEYADHHRKQLLIIGSLSLIMMALGGLIDL